MRAQISGPEFLRKVHNAMATRSLSSMHLMKATNALVEPSV